MEVSECIGVDSGNLKAVADVDVAVGPLLGRALPGGIDDVPVEGKTDWSQSL
jgi:hypothetical protein